MTHAEFMKLPLESRKRIESAIIDLNRAVEDTFGISMLDPKPKAIQPAKETL